MGSDNLPYLLLSNTFFLCIYYNCLPIMYKIGYKKRNVSKILFGFIYVNVSLATPKMEYAKNAEHPNR